MVDFNKYLIKLKEKCNLTDEFIMIINSLLDKLQYFGYISNRDKLRLSKKLLNNLKVVTIGKKHKFDYKSGYYDALKKELYLKDLNDISSVYLRLIYVLTTTKKNNEVYITGFSISKISNNSYKPEHECFGINRAIISNLVCRLLYTVPKTLEISPTYRTYSNDFIGRNIDSNNNIYYLEEKLLKQLLFITNVNEEKLYEYLFTSKPYERLKKLFKKIDIKYILNLLDNISRKYSNYSKLCFLNKLSSKAYINVKKHSLSKDSEWKKAEKLSNDVHSYIINILSNMYNCNEDETLELSLNECISELESSILSSVNEYQIALSDYLISMNKDKSNKFEYCKRLKKFKNILILNNDNLNQEIYKTITDHIVYKQSNLITNIIQKIRYSIINEFISEHIYSEFLPEFSFNVVYDDFQNSKLILLKCSQFSKLILIKDLHLDMNVLDNNIELMKDKNLMLLSNSLKSNKVETLYDSIKKADNRLSNITPDNIYLYQKNNTQFALVNSKKEIYVLGITKNFDINILNKSVDYKIIKNNIK